MILVLGKARSCMVPNLCCRGAESPGWYDVSPKHSAWDMMWEQVHCCDEAANHQLPIAAAFWITGIVFVEEYSSLMQKSDADLLLYSVTLNATATQYTCSRSGVYCPHWLALWSRHCSPMCTPVHSPWLPGYTDVTQTTLLISTMAGLFLDRPHILDTISHIHTQRAASLFWLAGYNSIIHIAITYLVHCWWMP